MAYVPASVGMCIDEALARAPRSLATIIEAACDSLQHQAGSGIERQEMAIAAGDLSRQRIMWCSAIAGELKKAIATEDEPAPTLRLNPSSLTLVDDSQVVANIESSRLAMEVESLVEKPLAELDKYMSAALGLEAITPEDSPLRPAVFARALRSVMD